MVSLLHGTRGLALAYATVQVPLAVAMLRGRARVSQLLASPLVAAPLLAASSLLCGLIGPESALGSLFVGTALSAGLGYATGRLLTRSRSEASAHQRGTVVVDARLTGSAKSRRPDEPSIGGQPVPARDESKHFKIVGTTGTGKSTAIAALIEPALNRGDRLVIADPDGGYLRRLYEGSRGDVILNPFDARSVKWDLFGEIRQPYDAEQLARALLPDPETGDASWCGYARTFLTALIRQTHASGMRDVGELFRLTSIAPVEELRSLVQGTPAQPFLEEHNVRMFDSVRSVASSAIASLEHVALQSGEAFSLRDWVSRSGSLGDTGGRGQILFMPYRADQIAALRSSVSAWMRLAIFETLAGVEGDQRLWFVIDELDALGKIDGLKDALARMRKFGGRCVLGFQSIAQVACTYGAGEAHTIVENCGNALILRCSGSEGGGTSRFASALIGQREVLRSTYSRSRRADELLGSLTRSEHLSVEPAVMDSEIEQLPDLTGYLKFASAERWQRITLRPCPERAADRPLVPAFVPAPIARGVTGNATPRRRARVRQTAAPMPSASTDMPVSRAPRPRTGRSRQGTRSPGIRAVTGPVSPKSIPGAEP